MQLPSIGAICLVSNKTKGQFTGRLKSVDEVFAHFTILDNQQAPSIRYGIGRVAGHEVSVKIANTRFSVIQPPSIDAVFATTQFAIDAIQCGHPGEALAALQSELDKVAK